MEEVETVRVLTPMYVSFTDNTSTILLEEPREIYKMYEGVKEIRHLSSIDVFRFKSTYNT